MGTYDAIRTIRIFISSPSDVVEERDRSKQVIDSLRRRYARTFVLKPVLWEELPLQLDVSFQKGIDLILSEDRGIDIAVFILWSRLGSAIGSSITRENGEEYRSGTERELAMMLQAREQGDGTRPALLAYTRRDESSFEERLRGKATAEKEDLITQKRLVESFIEETFTDKERGHNIRAFHSYDRPVTFSQRLRVHLVELLDQIAGEITHTAWDIDKQGAPFLGLEAFQPEHTDVFFGREEEILEARFALREQAKQGCAFLLITGASGSGKSSLARSGILPDIVHNEVDGHVAAWRSLIIMPSELASDPLVSLIHRLASPDVLPDLRNQRTTLEALSRGLRDNPQLTYDLAIKPAIEQLSEQNHGKVRLLLVIDQLEEMFAAHVMTASDRTALLKAIEVLASNGMVWVLATVRSDFFHHIQSEPLLMRLLEGRGPMPISPPGSHALQRLIEEPARMAGLRFEQRDDVSLSGRILRDAAAHAEMLPLVEFVLRELFESRTGDGLLTFSSYETLGGIEGAIGRKADEAIASLPEAAQDALMEVLPLLVTVEIAGEQAPTRRRAKLAELRANPARQVLVDSLISGRFLTTDQLDQEPVASLAHESLLRSWKQIERWVNFNREHLRIRARVVAAAANWTKQERRSDLLLAAGKPLEEANEMVSSGMPLDPLVEEFIGQSRIRVKRSRRLRKLAVASLAAMTIISIAFGGLAWISLEAANDAQVLSENRAAELTQQVYDNSIAIAERELTQNHDIVKASQLLESSSCPEEMRGWEWRYLMRLRDGGRPPLDGHTAGLWGAEISPDGSLIATVSIDGTMKVWNVTSGQIVRTVEAGQLGIYQNILDFFPVPRIPIMCLGFSPDGNHIATGSFRPHLDFSLLDPLHPKPDRNSPGLVQIWDVHSWKCVLEFEDQRGVALSLTYSPDGKRIASSSISPDNSFVVWDPQTGKVITRVFGHNSQIHRLRYSPDGKLLAAGDTDGIIKLWDANTLEQVLTIHAHTAPVVGLSFSPLDEHRLASAGEDGLVRIWRTDNGELLTELQGHSGSALDVRYSPDGTRIASGGFDKTVRVWDAQTGQEKITLRGHTDLVWSVSFSPNGQQLVSASFDNTARIWDARPLTETNREGEFAIGGHTERVNSVAVIENTNSIVSAGWDRSIRIWDADNGEPLAALQGHNGTVWCVDVSPDGSKVVSASWDHTAKIWDSKSGQNLLTFTEHTAPVHSVAFSPDGKKVASGGFDGQLKIWKSTDGKLIANCDGFIFPVMTVAFSPDGKYVASGGAQRKISIWDADTGEALMSLSGHTASVHGLAYSPAGAARLASASWDGTVRVWDVSPEREDAQRQLVVYTGHTDRVNGVSFSPDGKWIASASEDKTVRVWNADTGAEIVRPRRHRAAVWSARFAAKGDRLVSASWEKPDWIHVWKIKSQ